MTKQIDAVEVAYKERVKKEVEQYENSVRYEVSPLLHIKFLLLYSYIVLSLAHILLAMAH